MRTKFLWLVVMWMAVMLPLVNAKPLSIYVLNSRYLVNHYPSCNSSFFINDVVYDNQLLFFSEANAFKGFIFSYNDGEKSHILQCQPSSLRSLMPSHHYLYYDLDNIKINESYELHDKYMLISYELLPLKNYYPYISFGFKLTNRLLYYMNRYNPYRVYFVNTSFHTYPFGYNNCFYSGCSFSYENQTLIGLRDVARNYYIALLLCNSSLPLNANIYYRDDTKKITDIQVSYYARYLSLSSPQYLSFIFYYAKTKKELYEKEKDFKQKYFCQGITSSSNKKPAKYYYGKLSFEAITLANALNMLYNLSFFMPQSPFAYNLPIYCSQTYNPYAYFKALNDKALYTLDCNHEKALDLTYYSLDDYLEDYTLIYKIVAFNTSYPFTYYVGAYYKHAIPLPLKEDLSKEVKALMHVMLNKNILKNPYAKAYGMHLLILGNETYIPKHISDMSYAYLNDDPYFDLAVGRILYPSFTSQKTHIKKALLLAEYEQTDTLAFFNRFNGMFTSLMFNTLLIKHNVWVDRIAENRIDTDEFIEKSRNNYDALTSALSKLIAAKALASSSLVSAMLAIFDLVNDVAKLIHETDLTAAAFLDASNLFQIPELSHSSFAYVDDYDFFGYFGLLNSTHFLLPEPHKPVPYQTTSFHGFVYLDGSYSCKMLKNIITSNRSAYGICLETKKASRLAQERGAEFLKLALNQHTLGYSLIHSANLFVFTNSLLGYGKDKELLGRALYADPSIMLSFPFFLPKTQKLAYYLERKEKYAYSSITLKETLLLNLTPNFYINGTPFFIDSLYFASTPTGLITTPCNATTKLIETPTQTSLFVAVNLSQCNTSQLNLTLSYPSNKPMLLNVYSLKQVEIYAPETRHYVLYILTNQTLKNLTLQLKQGIHNYSLPLQAYEKITLVLEDSVFSYLPLKTQNLTYAAYITELYPNPEGREEKEEFIEIYKEDPLPANYTLQINNKNHSIYLDKEGLWLITKTAFLNSSRLITIDARYLLPNKNTKVALYHNGSMLSSFYYTSSKENTSFVVFKNSSSLCSLPTPLSLEVILCSTKTTPLKVVFLTRTLTPYKKEKLFKLYLKDKIKAEPKTNISFNLTLFNTTLHYNIIVGKSKTFYYVHTLPFYELTNASLTILYKNKTYSFNTSLFITPLNCSFSYDVKVPFVVKGGSWMPITYHLNAHYLPLTIKAYVADELKNPIKYVFNDSLLISKPLILEKHWRAPSLEENTPYYLITTIQFCNDTYVDEKLFVVKANKKKQIPEKRSISSKSPSPSLPLSRKSKKKSVSLIIQNITQHNNKLYAVVLVNTSIPLKAEIYSFIRLNNRLASYYCHNNTIKKGWQANKLYLNISSPVLINLTHCLKFSGKGYLKIKLLASDLTQEVSLPLVISNFSVIKKESKHYINASCNANARYITLNLYAEPHANFLLIYEKGNKTIFVKQRKTLRIISKNIKVYYNNTLLANCSLPSQPREQGIIHKVKIIVIKLINTLKEII